MSYTVTPDPLHNLRTDIEQLEDEFINLANHTFDIIKGDTVQEFQDHLINLNVRNKEMHKEFLDSNIFTETSDKSVRDMWRKLSYYSNFLNYTLVEHLIKRLHAQDLFETMKAYKRKLEIFCSKTRLCDFATIFKRITKFKEVLMEVKRDKNWETCTLQDMENWKETLTNTIIYYEPKRYWPRLCQHHMGHPCHVHSITSGTSESLKKTKVSAHSQNNEIMINMQRLEVGDR